MVRAARRAVVKLVGVEVADVRRVGVREGAVRPVLLGHQREVIRAIKCNPR